MEEERKDSSTRCLVTGAAGQIGQELVLALRTKYGNENVIATYHNSALPSKIASCGPCVKLDLTSASVEQIEDICSQFGITVIYHLAAILSGNGEKNPLLCWNTNITSLLNVLEVARKFKSNPDSKLNHLVQKVFWASSVACFGPTARKEGQTAEQSVFLDPGSIYGVSKASGELLCQYYYNKYRIDVRSIRYPGALSLQFKSESEQEITTQQQKGKVPSLVHHGGVTDFALEMIYSAAIGKESYECYLPQDSRLSWVSMDDCVKGTIRLMEAEASKIHLRTAYNMTGFTATPGQMADCIKRIVPHFQVNYVLIPNDPRPRIVASIPEAIDDKAARKDWGWNPEYDLIKTVSALMNQIKQWI